MQAFCEASCLGRCRRALPVPSGLVPVRPRPIAHAAENPWKRVRAVRNAPFTWRASTSSQPPRQAPTQSSEPISSQPATAARGPKRRPFKQRLASIMQSIASLGALTTISMRTVLLRRAPGPLGFVLLGFSAILLALTAVKKTLHLLFRIARACKTCHGFGVERCNMCEGQGTVRWDAKWIHTDPCPKCAGRRFCRCEDCGGVIKRRIFDHIPRNAGLEQNENAYASVDTLDKLTD